MVGTLRKKAHFFMIAATLLLSLTYCSKKSSNIENQSDGEGVNFDYNGDDQLAEDIGNILDGDSFLSQTDKTALKNAASDMQDVEPQNSAAISAALKAEVERLIELERKGKDVAIQKMALAGQILSQCMAKLQPPLPGEPLLGTWNGNPCGAATKKKDHDFARFTLPKPPQISALVFEILGGAAAGGGYTVKGGLTGKMGARPDGSGVLQAGEWQGELNDKPHAGNGVLKNVTFSKTKEGAYNSCAMGVTLQASRNPIPEKYIESVRILGKCYRMGLVLMSPMMDKMFENMNPQLATMLKLRMLGMGK